jgi:hypothetical protein
VSLWNCASGVFSWLREHVGALREHAIRNPLVWLLLALFVIAEYNNYQRGKELSAVCDVLPYADALPARPRTDLEKAQAICENRQYDQFNDD